MYPEFETKTSYKYLRQVISALQEPICLLGGWAVFLQVNKNFEKAQGRHYIGSRDIDLGFHFDKNCSIEQMENSALAKALEVLQVQLKFEAVSFRLLKEIHTETGEEIGDGTVVPAHFVFPMYVDLVVDRIPKKFKEAFHFQPVDEPLLRFAFEKIEHRNELKWFNKKLWLPKPELLLATKLKAIILRDKEHKKIKDLCDIFALLWYSQENPQELQRKVLQFLSIKDIKRAIDSIELKDYASASAQVAHVPEEVQRVIELMTL